MVNFRSKWPIFGPKWPILDQKWPKMANFGPKILSTRFFKDQGRKVSKICRLGLISWENDL